MILLQGEDQHSVYRTRERSTGLERGVQDRGEENRNGERSTGQGRGVQDWTIRLDYTGHGLT